MPLDFADFAHHYERHNVSVDARRSHFDAIVDVLECVARLYWRSDEGPNMLGITLDDGALSVRDGLESKDTLSTAFNRTAPHGDARKKES